MKNKAEVYRKIEKLVEGGFDKLQIITDFDRTLSKYHHNGEIMKSSYSKEMWHLCDWNNELVQ